MTDERAVEAGQMSRQANVDLPQADTIGCFEPNQLIRLTDDGRLYVVADGVSGSTSGQIAAQYAVKKILHRFYTLTTPDPQARLLEVIQETNKEIFDHNLEQPEKRPMATALMAALIHNNKLFVANVGDSRVYVVWDQDIERLNSQSDETPASARAESTDEVQTQAKMPATLAPAPVKTSEEKPAKPEPPAATVPRPPQGLGLEPQVEIETYTRRLFAGDMVLLCTGGLSGYVTEKEIARAITQHEPAQAIQRLLALAAQRGSQDHLALSVTRVLSSPVIAPAATPKPAPPAPKWSDWNTRPKPSSPVQTPPMAQTSKLAAPVDSQPQTDEASSSLLDDDEPQRRWPIFAGGALVLIVLCAMAWLVGRLLLPAELVASIPLFGEGETAVSEQDVVQDALEPETNDQASSTADEAGVTLVAESSSPLPTPEATFVSPVSTPAAASEQPTATATLTPTVPVDTPTPSPTPLPTIEVPAGCENSARFGRDVTVEDGTQFAPAEQFEKTWLLENAGDCPWGPGYTVRLIEGDRLGAETAASLVEITQPGGNGEITVPMIAPAAAGTYRGDWQLYDLNGEAFGPKFYLEIEVTAPDASTLAESDLTTLYDFLANAGEATWTSGEVTYPLQESDINETMDLPAPNGLLVRGPAQLRGSVVDSQSDVLLAYPHQELGLIEGRYDVDQPLQPTDALAATVGFIKESILSDDGVTFEVVFTAADGSEHVILSRLVQYQDSPVTEIQPLAGLEPGQTGTFTLRVLGGDSSRQDWAVWIDVRLIRP
jgi:protein phosphatase